MKSKEKISEDGLYSLCYFLPFYVSDVRLCSIGFLFIVKNFKYLNINKNNTLSRLDYAGITFLIPGSCYPPYYYFYYCEKCK